MISGPFTLNVGRGLARHIPSAHDPEQPVCRTGPSHGRRLPPWPVPIDNLPPCGLCAKALHQGTHPNLPTNLRREAMA